MFAEIASVFERLTDHCVFLLLVLPVVGAVLVIASAGLGVDIIRRTALTNVLISAFVSGLMVLRYDVPDDGADSSSPQYQMASESGFFRDNTPRNDERTSNRNEAQSERGDGRSRLLNVRIAVGVDGVSLWFVASVALLMIPAVIGHWHDHQRGHPAVFFALLLLMQAALVGVFAALDVVLFCVCLEIVTITAFFLIGQWGGAERRHVVLSFFLYQMAGSLLLLFGLAAAVLTHSQTSADSQGPERELSFSIARITAEIPAEKSEDDFAFEQWQRMKLLVFFPLVLGFALKMPLFPFHRWLPTTAPEMPAAVGLLMFGAVVNVGIYGAVRFLLPLFPIAGFSVAGSLMSWVLFSAVVAGLLALAQGDMRRTLAYAVVCHTGVSAAGIFSLNSAGVSGGMLRAVSLSLSLGGLAFLLGAFRRRYDTFEIKAYGGMVHRYPRLTFFFVLFAIAAAGLPVFGGFSATLPTLWGILTSGEQGTVRVTAAVAGMAASLLVAAALIWTIQRVFFGRFREPLLDADFFSPASLPSVDNAVSRLDQPQSAGDKTVGDLTVGEICSLTPIAVIVLWMGIAPQFFFSRITPALKRVVPTTTTVSGSSVPIPRKTMKPGSDVAGKLRSLPTHASTSRDPHRVQFRSGPPRLSRGEICR